MKKVLLSSVALVVLLISHVQAQWIEQATGFAAPSRGINQIVIVDKNVVWATAYNGLNPNQTVRDFTVTTNGGNNWTAKTVTGPPNNNNWSCLTAVSSKKAWAVFYKNGGNFLGGGLWHTSDGGTTWTQQTAYGSTSFPNVIYMWDENTGFTQGDPVGGEYQIYTTTNGGATWTPVPGSNIPNPLSGEYGLIRSLAVRGNTAWFGTTEGRIFRSDDMGNTWSVYNTGYAAHYVLGLAFANVDRGWAILYSSATDEYRLIRTTDGGTTWTEILTPGQIHFEIAYVPNTINTLVTSWFDGSTTFGSAYSLDGGDTWTDIDVGVQHLAVNFLSHTVGWSGGFNIDSTSGGIFKFDGSFVPTGSQQLEEKTSLSIYPNPSEGLFYFSYQTDNLQPIRVTVTDAVGCVVYDYDYENANKTWLRSIDLRSLPAGVYFFRLENAGQHAVHRLVKQ